MTLLWAAWAFISTRAGQAVVGPFAKAIAISAAAGLAVLLIVGGLWWLRSDAREDERRIVNAQWETRMANARIQAAALRQARQRKSEAVAAAEAARLIEELDAGRQRADELEQALDALKRVPVVCYPNEVLRRMP